MVPGPRPFLSNGQTLLLDPPLKGMPVLANGLSQMFNVCMSLGKFPEIWKMARITSIYKDCLRNEVSNYRPISVLPVVSRFFEKLVYEELYTYLNSNNLVHSGQSGFRSFHSVLTCLLKCTTDWYLNTDKGKKHPYHLLTLQRHSILLTSNTFK